jgi:hypothetical protein
VPEHDLPAGRRRRHGVAGEQRLDVVGDAGTARVREPFVGRRRHRGHRAARRHPDLGQGEERQVVLGVAEGDEIALGAAELLECPAHARRLVDAGWQQHERLAVEGELAVDAEAADDVEKLASVAIGSAENNRTRVEGDAACPQLAQKMRRRWGAEVEGPIPPRKPDDGAVFRDDRVEGRPVHLRGVQVGEHAAGHEQRDKTLGAGSAQRRRHLGHEFPVHCRRAVVVAGEHPAVHTRARRSGRARKHARPRFDLPLERGKAPVEGGELAAQRRDLLGAGGVELAEQRTAERRELLLERRLEPRPAVAELDDRALGPAPQPPDVGGDAGERGPTFRSCHENPSLDHPAARAGATESLGAGAAAAGSSV